MTDPHPWRGRLLVLAGIALAAINLRTAITSLTPLLDVVGDALAFGSGVAGVLGMLAPAAFALFGLATPMLAARFGLERTVVAAMLLAGAGLLARGLVGETSGLMLASIVALAGMGIGNVLLPPLVKRYFPDRIGAVSSLYLTSLQVGTMLPAFAAVPLAQAYGWRVSLGSWSVLAFVAVVPWLLVLWRGRSARLALPAQSADAVALLRPRPPAGARVWRSPLAWAMGTLLGMTSLITYAMFTWLPRWMTDAGATPAGAGALLGVYSAAGLVSSLLVPVLVTRMRQPFHLVLVMLVFYLVGFGGLLAAPTLMPALWVSLVALAGATFPLSLTLINLRTRTPAGSAGLSGFMQGLGYLLGCAGPIVVGLLREATGGWWWPVGFLGACVLVLTWSAWQACRPRMLEDSWGASS